MSLYIHEENQQILWRLFDKLPYVINAPNNPVLAKHKETIFKETIEYFYEQNKIKQLSVSELEKLNKETLVLINEKLVSTFNILREPTPKIQPSNYSSLSKPEIASLATEYIPYKDKPTTQNPFSETVGDEPISNMEELIEMYKKQRTADEPVSTHNV